MTDDMPSVAQPRVLLVNGAPGAGGAELVRHLRVAWRAAVVPVDDLDLALERSRPLHLRGEDPRFREARLLTLVKVGALIAQAYPPLAVAAMTMTSHYELEALLQGWRARGVEVGHVRLGLAEDELTDRILSRGGDADARRWALRHAHAVTLDLTALPADLELDVTYWDVDRLTTQLAAALANLGWIGPDGHWRTMAPALAARA